MFGYPLNPITAIWVISALATAGVIIRPFSWPEAIWAVLGGAVLLALHLIGFDTVTAGVLKGVDVYLFLLGMMFLAETARKEGLFDWLAALATKRAAGSPQRLFLLIFGVGAIVTIFLSNDATAVVLTPAVAASVQTAKVKNPLPYLFICALIANAASFVLPISNPANLVIYGAKMPPLLEWLPRFAIPSVLSILATYVVLRLTQRRALANETLAKNVEPLKLSGTGKLTAAGIAMTAVTLLVSSGSGLQLGLPTAICGLLTAIAVLILRRAAPWEMLKGISWGVLPLVAGLFVLVEALDKTGLIRSVGDMLRMATEHSEAQTAWGVGAFIAFACNLMNNLPAGLIAGSALQVARAPDRIISATLVGVDIGPNLSVTGSLATILWLTALKREGLKVSAWAFFKLGMLVMPPALLLAIGGLFVF
jgi:arsenical pump membrane protein